MFIISLIILILLYSLLSISISNTNNIELIDIGNNINIRIIRWGNKNDNKEIPIILIHGLASNALLWEGAAIELLKLGHSSIAIDLRGHGNSSKPDDGYDMDTVTSDISKLLVILSEKEGITKPILCGQSWGGNLVIEVAHKYKHLISGVCTVDGGFIQLSNKYSNFDQCWDVLQPPYLIGKNVNEIRNYFKKAHPDWSETAFNGMMSNFEVDANDTIKPFLTYDRHKLVLKGLWEHYPSLLYHEIEVPVLFLVVQGGSFYDDKVKMIDKAQQVIPRCKVIWFIADHDLHAQHPQKFASEVNKWFNKLS